MRRWVRDHPGIQCVFQAGFIYMPEKEGVMAKHISILVVLAAVLGLALLFIACGGGGDVT